MLNFPKNSVYFIILSSCVQIMLRVFINDGPKRKHAGQIEDKYVITRERYFIEQIIITNQN
jgi:hypothetical protein